MRNFRELEIWKDSMKIVTEIYSLIEQFPNNEKFGLTSQISRSAVSIPSNISEGCRGSDKELVQFLNMALGSSFELETQLEISYNIKYINKEKFEELTQSLNVLQKRMNAFRNSVKYK